MPQAQLGSFVFSVGGPEYRELRRTAAFRWAKRERLGRPPARQYLGPQEQQMTLGGHVIVETASDLAAVERLRREAGAPADGAPGGGAEKLKPLDFFLGGSPRGSGDYLGTWVVDEISETHAPLNGDGTPARIEFSLKISYHGE